MAKLTVNQKKTINSINESVSIDLQCVAAGKLTIEQAIDATNQRFAALTAALELDS